MRSTHRWLIFWLSGLVPASGTTLIGQIQSSRYESNAIVTRLGFQWTYVLMAVLTVIIVVAVSQYQGTHRRLLHALLGLVGASRWIAGTAAALSLLGVVR